jgi:hypothetical protein
MSLAQLRAEISSFLAETCRFLRGNPGAIPIVGFQVLLLACAGLLIAGLPSLAEGVAVVAYFLLVAGVVVQLVVFVRDRNRS